MALNPDRLQAMAGYRRAMRQFLAASEAISRAAGVTQQQYQAMLAIAAWTGPMTMKDLSEELLLTHHAAVQLVDRLAKADLARRRPSTADRRSVELSLTSEGAALLEDLMLRHQDEVLKREPALSSSLRRLRRLRDGG
jgi:DNA-binding MarR family transcriptional regulator